MEVDPCVLDASSELGRQYFSWNLAARMRTRGDIGSRAAKMLGATVLEEVHNYGDSTPVLHQLTPVGIAMASAKEFDLYRD
jgi:hypothetical protein